MKERNYKTNNRNFTLFLYPQQDKTHKEAIERIKKTYDYAMIEHDKDIYTEDTEEHAKGEIKKIHTHVIIRVGNNPRWTSAVAEELGITETYIQGCNLDKQLRYLIHFDQPEKYQYDISKVSGTLKKRLVDIVNKENKTENERAKEFLDLIINNNITDVRDLAYIAIENGYYDILRKGQQMYLKIIDKNKAR